MILQALTAYYEARHQIGKMPDVGWDDLLKVTFELEIDDNGTLIDVIDCRELIQRGKKQVLEAPRMCVPAHIERSVEIAPNFLCDNSSYLFGADNKGKSDRPLECFTACADRLINRGFLLIEHCSHSLSYVTRKSFRFPLTLSSSFSSCPLP